MKADWLEPAYQLTQGQSLEERRQQVSNALANVGFDQCLFVPLPGCLQSAELDIERYWFSTFDSDWLDYYARQNLVANDAPLKHCLSGQDTPYLWPSRGVSSGLSRSERNVYQEARSAGLISGVTLPCRNSLGEVGVVSVRFAGTESDFLPLWQAHQKDILHLLYAVNDALFESSRQCLSPAIYYPITRREREVLQWLAAGLTYDEVAKQLMIGISTVRKHVASGLQKLQARNTTHAAVLAARWGWL
ncbi:transcriptional activator protein LasR [Bacterioplanes sanyensis]|uniref:LuxR family transcriptional regulator n=1 Tax=Bacterioplanes sanyensis TaxID=1249553 RepID=UPI0016739602|nr:LuxR family transcriptional regulator [Bacterioplanes sanyensis]GGY47968.1 transcriptional activator protein LasR [Bacterioplanes sanyensis]